MNKMLAAAVAAVIAGTSLGVASAAEAQSRYDRHDRRETVQPRPAPRVAPTPPRVAPTPPRVAPAPPAPARWQRAQRRYSAPRYVAPRGYQTRNWSYGQRMPDAYRSRTYVVSDYSRYGLGHPPRGYQYVRSGNDVVMTAIATGFISAIIVGLFN